MANKAGRREALAVRGFWVYNARLGDRWCIYDVAHAFKLDCMANLSLCDMRIARWIARMCEHDRVIS